MSRELIRAHEKAKIVAENARALTEWLFVHMPEIEVSHLQIDYAKRIVFYLEKNGFADWFVFIEHNGLLKAGLSSRDLHTYSSFSALCRATKNHFSPDSKLAIDPGKADRLSNPFAED